MESKVAQKWTQKLAPVTESVFYSLSFRSKRFFPSKRDLSTKESKKWKIRAKSEAGPCLAVCLKKRRFQPKRAYKLRVYVSFIFQVFWLFFWFDQMLGFLFYFFLFSFPLLFFFLFFYLFISHFWWPPSHLWRLTSRSVVLISASVARRKDVIS